jgi:Asp-tRNA(Asn)/Glu-tRNA(Gln) amidotransferase A subunit family amidase
MAIHLMDLDLHELIDGIQSGRVTPLQSVEACFGRIEQYKFLNAFTCVCKVTTEPSRQLFKGLGIMKQI